ncbi:SgcJ/EcaC family oxidoreductase [Nocardia sp. alder85J]|uniref:SgcJ/EcaC family oxidoreductase n=1 Tax=Nocardia sp. alder85J TaxID=2862949 RepID=UPI001CD59F06|nr:SgcJ/EcaC family oxidoreductase [Nocardia sp. alder85J]MCX4098017.1 SgcJ/EcaC family oxidoreductase [Nocardia sp. alder85J]
MTVGDESAIRTLYRSLLDSWPDPDAYAAHFAADVDYIIADGTIEHGRGDIIDCHHTIFGTWARNSTLAGDIDNIRFLTPDVAIITAHGHIVLPDNPRPPRNTVYTLTTHKTDRTWSIVAYQNTPVDG